jgi:Leucine-rich repeat (LRR) protein
MHNCKLDTLGKDIDVFQNLEELDVSVNNLKSLPIDLGKLKKLKRLDLSCNRLTAFPKTLIDLPALELLDLRFNDSNAFKSNTKTAIDIPVQFMERLPNCKVLL